MKRVTIVPVTAVLAWAATFAGAATAATPYHDPAVGVSVTPPPGWYDIPQATLGRMAASVTNHATQPPDYVAGFTSAADGSMRFPYILVQRQQVGPVNFDAVANAIEAGAGTGADLKWGLRSDLANKVTMGSQGQATVDRAAHTFVRHFQIAGPAATIQGTTYGFAGKDQMIDVHCYDTPAHYATSDAAFRAVADSVAFDPGSAYVVPAGPGGGGFGSGGGGFSGINWQSGAVIGGVVGLVVWGIAKAARRAS